MEPLLTAIHDQGMAFKICAKCNLNRREEKVKALPNFVQLGKSTRAMHIYCIASQSKVENRNYLNDASRESRSGELWMTPLSRTSTCSKGCNRLL